MLVLNVCQKMCVCLYMYKYKSADVGVKRKNSITLKRIKKCYVPLRAKIKAHILPFSNAISGITTTHTRTRTSVLNEKHWGGSGKYVYMCEHSHKYSTKMLEIWCTHARVKDISCAHQRTHTLGHMDMCALAAKVTLGRDKNKDLA